MKRKDFNLNLGAHSDVECAPFKGDGECQRPKGLEQPSINNQRAAQLDGISATLLLGVIDD